MPPPERCFERFKARARIPGAVESLALTPDGKAIAVTSQGKFIHLIDFESGKTIRTSRSRIRSRTSRPASRTVLAIAFSPDGKLMASGGYDNDQADEFARLWDVETGKELRRFLHGKQSYGIREPGVFSRRENTGDPRREFRLGPPTL